jgi:tetratricopeptide (TPR) repeat protein
MIVKNEAAHLGRCLQSVAGHVDEIVIVDTGSTDGTQAIAERHAARLFDFAWRDDFAAARQYAFDQAGGDWVVWVDADDVVVGAEHIRPQAAAAPEALGAFYWRYVTGRDRWGNATCEFWRERCVRNDGTFRWEGRIHEVLVAQRPWQTLRTPDVVVEHRSTDEPGAAKQARNLAILEADYAATTAPSPRLLYYLAREEAAAGRPEQALAHFDEYLQIAGWDDERYLAQVQVADLLCGQERFGDAIDANLQALKICPHWPNAYFALARCYYFLQEWHKVIHWSDVGRAMPVPDTLHIVNPMDFRYDWIIYYTNALVRVGAAAEALRWTRHALTLCPDDPWHRHNLALLSSPHSSSAGPPADAHAKGNGHG